MRVAVPVLLLTALGPASAVAEPDGGVACAGFKESWAAALQRLEPGRPPLSFTPAPNLNRPGERVDGLGGVEAWVSCADGKLRHVEIRESGADPAPPTLARAAAGVLMAFDGEITPAQAAGLVEALGAEARAGRDAVSGWGAYELTFGRPAGGAAFMAELHGN